MIMFLKKLTNFQQKIKHLIKDRKNVIITLYITEDNGARKTYLILNKAIIKYENGNGTKDELLYAFDSGEKIMTESTYED